MNKVHHQKTALREVARRAGVSLGTASNVFAQKPGVAEKTREAVMAAAQELGYQPAPRSVTPSQARVAVETLGFVVRSMPEPLLANPFYSQVLHGAEQACKEQDISMMYAALDEDVTGLEQLPPLIQRRQIQGLLVVGYFNPAFFDLLQRLAIPFVMIDYFLDSFNVDSVLSDDEQGGYLATSYLLKHVTHPQPAIIAGNLAHSSIRARWQGYRRALAEYGLPYDERYVGSGYHSSAEGHRNMLALLDLPEPPNAVFCANDVTAIGVLSALRERGVAVPRACAVVGFDDIDLAAHTVPALTTIKVDKEALGAEGVRLLLERIAHSEMTPRRTTIAVSLVERASVRPIALVPQEDIPARRVDA